EATELRGRAAHLRHARLFDLARLEKASLALSVRDRGAEVVEDALRFVADGCQNVAAAAVADDAAGIGERLRERVDEDQLGAADADDVARPQEIIARDPLAADHRAIAAIEIAEHPLAAAEENFDVVAAAAVVLEHDLAGRCTADRRRLPGHEPEDVAPLCS